jgi:hypothetical protein
VKIVSILLWGKMIGEVVTGKDIPFFIMDNISNSIMVLLSPLWWMLTCLIDKTH